MARNGIAASSMTPVPVSVPAISRALGHIGSSVNRKPIVTPSPAAEEIDWAKAIADASAVAGSNSTANALAATAATPPAINGRVRWAIWNAGPTQ